MRRLVQRFVREEDGITLVIALATMMVLAITTTGVLLAGTVNQREAYVSGQAREAFAIAQEGLAYAEGAVYSGALPVGTQALPTQPIGSGTYSANCSTGTCYLTGTGTVGGVTRTVTAQASPPSTNTVQQTGVWNYLYADSTSTCLSISGNVTVSVPILARGNICLSGGGHIINGTSAITLAAGGTISDIGGSNIGASSSKLTSVQIGGCTAWNSSGACTTTTSTGCTVQPNSVFSVAPGTSYCNGAQSPLWANQVVTTLSVTPAMPCIGQSSTLDPQCPSSTATWSTLNTVYNTQKTATKSSCPSNLLDSDSTLNNSLSASTLTAAMFNKTTGYDCKVTSGATTIGEIKWAPGSTCGSGTLNVSGTLYFDGSLDLKCGWKIQYTGQATLYFTGTVTQEGGTQLCGIANCTSAWDPDVNGIIFVAGCWTNSTGSTLASSACVDITGGSTAQWGAYATTNYELDGGSSNMGPVLANTDTLGGGASSLIPFHKFPPGTPLANQTVTLPGTPPTNWSG